MTKEQSNHHSKLLMLNLYCKVLKILNDKNFNRKIIITYLFVCLKILYVNYRYMY